MTVPAPPGGARPGPGPSGVDRPASNPAHSGGDGLGPVPGDAGCELCEAALLTEWHYEDDVCWVADCEVCSVPMVVWRRHGADPPARDLQHMVRCLAAVADARFGSGGWSMDPVMRQIPDHFHLHGRDPNWWSRRFDRR